jgi:hypothetical protein
MRHPLRRILFFDDLLLSHADVPYPLFSLNEERFIPARNTPFPDAAVKLTIYLPVSAIAFCYTNRHKLLHILSRETAGIYENKIRCKLFVTK